MNEKKTLRKNGFFVLMLTVNISMVVCLIYMFNFYSTKNDQQLYDKEIDIVKSGADEIINQINLTLINGDMVTRKYAEYIAEEKLSELETINYLRHWMEFYYEIDYVSVKTLNGVRMRHNPNNGKIKIDDMSFKNVPGIADMLTNYDSTKISEESIRYSIPLKFDEPEVYYISYYQPTVINGDEKVMYFVVPIDTLEKLAKNLGSRFGRDGMLIDGDGKVLFGTLPGENCKPGDNIYEIFNEIGNDEEKEKIEKMKSSEDGRLMFTSIDGKEWLLIYGNIVGKAGFKFICFEDNEGIDNHSDSLMAGIRIFLIMFAWMLVDISGYFIYNKMLIKTLKKVDEKNRDLEAANLAKNMFISNMSHEIRTPINAVLGMDEMILRETDDEQIREYATNIQNAGKVLLGIINDVLDYSKIESGKLEIIPDEYDIGSVVNDLCNIIHLKTKEKNLELKLNVNPKTPHMLFGDEIRIKQIILNLLTNAVKYTEQGSITFSVDFEPISDDKIILIVAVKDTGIGIKPEEMDKLCSAFERLDERRNRTIEGTGLGMSIVTRLLNNMGGKLSVESDYGRGSCFTVRLEQPVMDKSPVGDINDMKIREEEHVDNQAVLRASRASVLVVDDTKVNLTVVKGLLKRTGIHVDTAESGFECLEMIKVKKYDVILLDHRMPQMDGIETLQHIKKMGEPYCSIPVIALTANVVSGAYEMYIKAGFTDFLSKPVKGIKLEKMILKYLPEELLDSKDDLCAQIDEKSGTEACGSSEVYNQVLNEFVTVHEKNKNEIMTFFENRDTENYVIKVHALKSSARLVGANVLSSEAKELEDCGNDGKWDIILEKTPILIKHYEMVVDNISNMLGLDKADDGKEPVDEKWLAEAFRTIKELNEAFDYDSIDGIMESIAKYKLSDENKALYEKLKVGIYEFDQEAIRKLLENV